MTDQPTIRGLRLARAADDGPGLRMGGGPRFVRVVDTLPRTGTDEVARCRVRADAWSGEGTWVREGHTHRPRTDDDIRLGRAFEAAGRAHLRPGGSP